MPRMNIVQLAASLVIFHCRVVANDQIIVYEAGAADWATQGSITTRPLADFSCPPGATFPGTAGDSNPKVFLLNSSSGSLDLRFNGTGISVFGITFSSSTCDAGDDAVVAFLDESPPPAPINTGVPLPSCSVFPTPTLACGVLLAQYGGLNKDDNHHIFISSSGAQVGVLNAQVALDGDPPLGPATVVSEAAPTTTTGGHPGDGEHSRGPVVTPEPAPTPKTGRHREDSEDGEPAPTPTTGRHQENSVDGEPAPGPSAVAPGAAQTTTTVRHRAPVAVILPAVLVPIGLLSFIAGLFLVIRRRRQRASTSHIKPLPFSSRVRAEFAHSPPPAPPPAGKHLPGNAPTSAAPPDAGALEHAIAAAGITPLELVASLNRLGEQARVESPLASGQAPPRYEG